MPTGLVRYQEAGDLHFVTISCYERRPYFRTPAARDLFENALDRMRQRYKFCVVAYVVMPEHVHLLVTEPQISDLATAMQAVKLSVTRRRPERPFWLPRYHDFNVFSEKKMIEKWRYIHRNPIARGLTTTPDGWEWSRFQHWWSGAEGTVEIESPWTARRRGGLPPRLNRDSQTP